MITFDPKRPDYQPYGFTCVSWKPCIAPRFDHHNEIELNLILSGSVHYLIAGQKLEFQKGELVAFWAMIPHKVVDFSSDDPYFVATLPFDWVHSINCPSGFLSKLLEGHIFVENTQPRNGLDAKLFACWENELGGKEPILRELVAAEIKQRLLRLAYHSTVGPEMTESKAESGAKQELQTVEKIACFVAQNYTRHLTVNEIAESVFLNPCYAMSLFKKQFGITLVQYLNQHRLAHAERQLITTKNKIIQVALESGFQSLSRFNEIFRQIHAVSPSEYRKSNSLHELSDITAC